MYTYIGWLALFVWLPLLTLWVLYFQTLRRYKRTMIFCVFWALVFSVPWDWWAIRTRIWIFPPDTNVGIWVGGIPLEEYLFIIFVTALISTITLVLRDRARKLLIDEEE